MECASCGFDQMVLRVVDETIGANENALTVHGLKAHVCPKCDDAVFDHASYVRLTGIQASWLKQQSEFEVHRLRQQLNVTQRELAELMGVGTLAVSRYERGVTTPTGPFMKLLRLLSSRPELIATVKSI
jgi:HTH-type transcriptional regulator / antitoxin MqsA